MCLKLRGHDEDDQTYRANTVLLFVGLVGNLVLLAYVVYDDPASLWWAAGLLAIGLVLFLVEMAVGRNRPPGTARGSSAPGARGPECPGEAVAHEVTH